MTTEPIPQQIADRIKSLKERGILGNPKLKPALQRAVEKVLRPLGAFNKPPSEQVDK